MKLRPASPPPAPSGAVRAARRRPARRARELGGVRGELAHDARGAVPPRARGPPEGGAEARRMERDVARMRAVGGRRVARRRVPNSMLETTEQARCSASQRHLRRRRGEVRGARIACSSGERGGFGAGSPLRGVGPPRRLPRKNHDAAARVPWLQPRRGIAHVLRSRSEARQLGAHDGLSRRVRPPLAQQRQRAELLVPGALRNRDVIREALEAIDALERLDSDRQVRESPRLRRAAARSFPVAG